MSLYCFVENLATAATPRPDGPQRLRLSDEEARHARLARRLSVGDAIMLFDGAGRQAIATIAVASKSVVEVSVGEITTRSRPRPALTLAVAMPKGPRQDVLIEKCAELGVATIQPLVTERSVAGASDHRRDKWRRTAIEAAKQSGQCWIPTMHAPAAIGDVLATASGFDLVLAAMVPRELPPARLVDLVARVESAATILAFVGPEGGWAPAEAKMLVQHGAVYMSLGPNVLRIETAAVAVAAVVHGAWRS